MNSPQSTPTADKPNDLFGPISKRGSKAWWSIKPRYFLLTKSPDKIYKLEYYSDEKLEKMKKVIF